MRANVARATYKRDNGRAPSWRRVAQTITWAALRLKFDISGLLPNFTCFVVILWRRRCTSPTPLSSLCLAIGVYIWRRRKIMVPIFRMPYGATFCQWKHEVRWSARRWRSWCVWIQISPLPPVHLFSLDASLVHRVELARGKYYLHEIWTHGIQFNWWQSL